MRTTLLPIVLVASMAGTAPPDRQSGIGTATLVERVGRYVEDYERAFAAVISEELQTQRLVRPDGTVRKTRELRSDFLLIKTGSDWAQVFRDVIEVDGKPVRNREDRLRRLFLETTSSAIEQARRISRESERYNIGFHRTGNSPLLPLLFLHPRYSGRSRFEGNAAALTFQEVQTPTVLKVRRGDKTLDLPARGVYVANEESGKVTAAEFTAIGPVDSYSASMAVNYGQYPGLELMVPRDAHERYWYAGKPKDDRLEVESRYSNFRRFQVQTEERIKKP